ncbi:MAG: phage holin family protein [Planctomycetaceae bacterium]|nr:phage holin family protein [Planctomycetaceae bacterium]
MDSIAPQSNADHDTKSRPGIRNLVHDSITLLELQGQLLKHDWMLVRTGTVLPLLGIILGLILGLSCLPLLLFGLASGLSAWQAWPMWFSAFVVALAVGLVPASTMAIFGYRALHGKLQPLSRSIAELNRNVLWLKKRLTGN